MEPVKEFNLKAIFNEIVDVDRLVELVKVRPVIWDNTVDGYRNRDMSMSAWQDIYRVMFENYDSLHQEQKMFIGKVIKDKWTNARDLWQRSHKKRKEALQKGENVNDLKDNARYEKLKFLAKLYNKDDNLKPREGKVLASNYGFTACPPFPKVDSDVRNEPNLTNTDFSGKPSTLIDHRTPQKQGFDLSSRKRKTENSNAPSPVGKKYKETSPNQPVAVNLGDKLKAGISSSPGKHQTSVGSRVIDKIISNRVQSQSCEPIYPTTVKEEIPANAQLMKKTFIQIPQKLAARTPSQLHQGNFRRSSISNDEKTKPELIEKAIKQEVNYTKTEQTSNRRPSQDNKSVSSELDQFFQVLRPRIEDFNKTQIITFLFEILKPHIKDFDKHQLLDFQIETLQLIKKIEGN